MSIEERDYSYTKWLLDFSNHDYHSIVWLVTQRIEILLNELKAIY